MELKICLDSYLENNNLKIDNIKFQKMLLLFNALEEGWSVKKKGTSYIFTKNHQNKKEVLEESYLMKFMNTNLDLSKIIS
jgi:hypothetical protein